MVPIPPPTLMESKLIMPKKCTVTPTEWDQATDLFELGFRHAKDLALELGVSPQTVMREMRRRGAKKGSRAFETVVDLEKQLDRKLRYRVYLKAEADRLAVERSMATLTMLDGMMAALLEGDRQGDLTLAGDVIEITGSAFGLVSSSSRRRERS